MVVSFKTVSYTHLDVYKRQGISAVTANLVTNAKQLTCKRRDPSEILLPNRFTKSAEIVNDRNFDLK